MIIYIIFYLIDDVVVFVLAMVTLKVTGITTKYNRYADVDFALLHELAQCKSDFNRAKKGSIISFEDNKVEVKKVETKEQSFHSFHLF